MGHEERFPPTRLSAGCGFRKETIAGMRRNGRDAPKADHHNRFGIDSLNAVSGLREVAHTTTAVRVAGEKSDKGTFHGTALRRGSNRAICNPYRAAEARRQPVKRRRANSTRQ
jgi:hypothetical protein